MGFFDFGDDDVDFSKAGDIFKQYEEQAQELARQRYGEGRGDITKGYGEAIGYQEPYMGAGKEALSAYLASIGLGPKGQGGVQDVYNKFTSTPGYQFALNQGLQTVNRTAAATGRTGSGAEQLALQKVGQGLADQDWQQYYQNYQNRLADIAGRGQQAATTAGGFAGERGMGLANLGYGYTGMQFQGLENLGSSLAEMNMAQQMARMKQNSSMWGGLGSLFGGGAGFFLSGGNPWGAMIGSKIGGGGGMGG